MDETIKNRMSNLIITGSNLARGNQFGQVASESDRSQAVAWLVSAQNIVHLICSHPQNPYRQIVDRIATEKHGWVINKSVGEVVSVLENLFIDANSGLLASMENKVKAETFDNFLDHSQAYLSEGRKSESGVIAGVVFEDTIRQMCRVSNIAEKGVPLDELISELAKRGDLSGVGAKRARAAAHVRTKASHAQWDEFELSDVKAAIEFTRELITSKLDE